MSAPPVKFNTFQQVVLGIALLVLGFILGGFLVGDSLPVREIVAGLVTLLAAYLGAHFAFRLQNEREIKERTEQQVAAANRAIVTLYDLWNLQKNYQSNHINPKRNGESWFEILPTIPGMHKPITFDVSKMDFLLSGGKPEIYTAMLQEEKRYGVFLSIVDERSRLMFEEVRPVMQRMGVQDGEHVEAVSVEVNLGVDCTTKLKSLTDNLIMNVDENIESLETLYDDLRRYLHELLPQEQFISVIFSQPDKTS